MPTLLIISPAPILETAAGEVVLDVDFVEGMKRHCQLWPGTVYCLMRRGAATIPGGVRFSPRQLDFRLIVHDQGADIPDTLLEEASLIYCAADDMQYLGLPKRLHGKLAKLVFTIERPLSGRLRQAVNDRRRTPLSRLRGMQWALSHEPALRRALVQASGLHCNGPLAAGAYARLNPRTLSYMDNRMRLPMLARGPDQAARAERLRAGAPLTLASVCPLEPETGVFDLLSAAHVLNATGVDYRMQIFGTGSLFGRLTDGIAALKLKDRVQLAEPPGFETSLVPHLRRNADVFLAPWQLSDPVSGYIDAMGCGIPVLGYRNPLWRKLLGASGGGWSVPARPAALVSQLQRLNADRDAIAAASGRALEHARANTFETVFARRMSHLREIAGLD